MTQVLVLTALQSELQAERAPDGVAVRYCGVGKINTAIATTLALNELKPRLVVNYGTCGKISDGLTGLLEVAHVVQRDMMAMPLAPRGVTPLMSDEAVLASGFGGVICGTGDSFVTAADPWLIENKVDVVDMELFAVAHACARFGVPWRAFKFITDDANDVAHEHWTANVANGEDLFWDLLRSEILKAG
ncbi:5'-methylthioadenosine nucleosidase [Bradyrhizobium sp. WD16]|uniref:phosphorylase family protein n=1 Tax=Bradyrhizobium sp. WD16 TaxID=1521768 RepID=UPI0020A414A6|nr:5'-methylthioadenosine nucleosidase [Bradyrhizobium sp. WD16]UTD26507.1 5'-methylthioadenosine nucleosidase [Bradyrhizobium sp. WD16]